MKKNQLLELSVEKLAFGGKGLAKFDNKVVFVEGGLPGDKVIARIRKIKSNYVDTKLITIKEYSELRQKPACPHFGICGGCRLQNLSYSEQLHIKRTHVLESIEHIAGFENAVVHPTLPSPKEFGYRNKMEFSFTDNRWLTTEELDNPENKKDFALGLHVPGGFDRVMHIEKCWLADQVMNDILSLSQSYFKNSPIPVFNLKTHLGQLRFLVLRKSEINKHYMANIVTFTPARDLLKEYVDLIKKNIPAVKSIVNTVNRRVAQIAYGEEEYVLYGNNYIEEKLNGFNFDISANSFFQTNSLQAERLYKKVISYIGINNNLVWDLYSGTGTIALFISKVAQKVVGFELVESAVKNAYTNCKKNGVENCEFVFGDLRHQIKKRTDIPETIICDPPRSGMHPEVVEMISNSKAEKVIYLSCNPSTMARDLKILLPFYKLVEVQPVDMFPHTYHIESVAELELR